ncbi:MAG: hypothetical protein K0R54_75 [Clostridiaceae bacterium]|jgi:hypothetical protein|nr:hypothetical protein [Clostridiaceae bacterium]
MVSKSQNVKFLTQDYKLIKTYLGDLIYLDAPYLNTAGMYYGKINYEDVAMSFDGKQGEVDKQAMCQWSYLVNTFIYIQVLAVLKGLKSRCSRCERKSLLEFLSIL